MRNQPTEEADRHPLSEKLQDNLKRIQERFAGCDDFLIYPWSYGAGLEHNAFCVYFETLVLEEKATFMKQMLQDLVPHEIGPASDVTPEDVKQFFSRHGVSGQPVFVTEQFEEVVRLLLDGCCMIFFDGWNKALGYNAFGVKNREPAEPITEPVVEGPHISTNEDLNQNIGLIRNLVRSPRLKFHMFTVGQESRREVAYGYLEGAVNPETLSEFERRIAGIDKEELMETSYLEDWVVDSIWSPFPQTRHTERPDTAAASLLDGKIVAMMHGSPTILICPGLFFEFFVSSEDYYQKVLFSNVIRHMRIGAFFIALMLPSTYIALTTFHSELIPTVLLLAILDTREGIPFPALVEALIMEFFFELLREAGIRLPRPIGSAVSIVGALVIGQAAIQARIASPAMVIVVALTGIASFSLPQYRMAIAIRILRFPLMIFAATLGGLGVMLGFLLTFLHLAGLRSLGQPYLSPLSPLRIRGMRDLFLLAPRKVLVQHPRNRHRHKKP